MNMPGAALELVRLERARTMLARSNLTIGQVAAREAGPHLGAGWPGMSRDHSFWQIKFLYSERRACFSLTAIRCLPAPRGVARRPESPEAGYRTLSPARSPVGKPSMLVMFFSWWYASSPSGPFFSAHCAISGRSSTYSMKGTP